MATPARPRIDATDVLVAAVSFGIAASTAALGAAKRTEDPFTLAAGLTLAVQSAVLVARRRHPLVVWFVVGFIAAVYGIADWADPLVPVPAIVGLVSVFEFCARRTALAVLAATTVIAVIATALPSDSDALDWGVVVLVLVLSPMIGEMLRARHEQVAELEARNASLTAEHEQAVAEARRLERMRIARELHDVVTHNVSMLVVQAEASAATHAMTDGQRVAAFDALADGGRAALGELRQLLGVLRDPDEGAPSAPTAGVERIGELVSRARQTGIEVEYSAPDATPSLPAAVDLAAYRIVQEGLTNVVRHAGAHRAEVRVTIGSGDLVVTVDDDGRGAADAVDGVGMTGLRERVALLGGELTAEPRPLGGHRLTARMPIGGAA